jgi:signal transduction histidine kinase
MGRGLRVENICTQRREKMPKPRINEMRSLQEYMSPLSLLICSLCVLPTLLFMLHATPLEFGIMFGVDLISFWFFSKIDFWIYEKLYPEVKLFFREPQYKIIQTFSENEKIKLLESFFRFPVRRTVFVFFVSFFKILPATLVIVFIWKHSISNWEQFFVAIGISSINFFYFSGGIFLESHIYLSNLIRELHRRFDFSEAFSHFNLSYSKKDFSLQENLALFSVVFYVLGLQLVFVLTYPFSSRAELAIKLLVIGLAGGILLLRLWHIRQRFFMGGLETLFESMGLMDYKKSWNDLSFHTSPLLAQFEKTFNLLSRRVRRSEQELSVLITQEAEKSRFRALGEMSALVAHDLASPMHFIQFCVDQLEDDPSPEKLQKYIGRLSQNTTKAIQLIDSIKARLKNPSNQPQGSNFVQTHTNVLRLLTMQFFEKDFRRIQFVLDSRLESIHTIMSQVDLTHVLDNLYRNSVKNLLDHSIHNPTIQVQVAALDTRSIEIRICDNGTGLSHERFEELTAYRYTQSETNRLHQGLGLRLTRRLIEYQGGQLKIITDPDAIGTTYQMILLRDREPLTNRMNQTSPDLM